MNFERARLHRTQENFLSVTQLWESCICGATRVGLMVEVSAFFMHNNSPCVLASFAYTGHGHISDKMTRLKGAESVSLVDLCYIGLVVHFNDLSKPDAMIKEASNLIPRVPVAVICSCWQTELTQRKLCLLQSKSVLSMTSQILPSLSDLSCHRSYTSS